MLELKKEHSSLLKDFIFDMDRPFPYCEDIEFAIDCLEGSNLLNAQGPYLTTYRITERLVKYFREKTSKTFTREQLSELEQLAKNFIQN